VGARGSANFSDTTVAAGTTYTYQIYAFDFFLNSTASSTFTVTTPPSGGIDPRRVGVRPTGAYWGASPEQIDVLSGNLSYSLPLLKAQGRNGWGVGFSLSYNSQNWRKDSGGTWDLGRDVGFGYGWKLLAGSLTPYWSSYWTVDHWGFTDSTGAEYRLTNDSSGVWTSTESIYLSYDSNAGILHFPDGSFWVMGAVSGGAEQDAGTYYPTVMEDTNGNQVLLSYATGVEASWSNSSARITSIADVRAVNPGSGVYSTYNFTYNSDNIPHLTGISNTIGTGESYSFDYSYDTLIDPFASSSYGSTTFLNEANVLANSTDYLFTYDGSSSTSGTLAKVTLPYKGYIRWTYLDNYAYSGSRYQLEVTDRYLSKDGTSGSEQQYPFYHESPGSLTIHACTTIDDPAGLGEKYWAFSSSGANQSLTTYYQGRSPLGGPNCSTSPGTTAMTQTGFTWTQDSASNNYIGEVVTTADLGTSSAISKETTQTVDVHGNVTQVNNYNWGLSLARTYNYGYLNSGSYPSLYIFNRLTSATVTPSGGSAITLGSISYDGSSLSTPSGSAPREWDSSYTSSVTTRGNVTSSTDVSGNTTTNTYDIYGNTTATTVNGVTSTASTSSTTNFAAPDSITVNSTLTTSMTYNSFLGLTNETGPNSTSVDIGYDSAGRPQSSTSAFGATTNYQYYDSASPPNSCSSVNTRWTETILDGLGRALKVLTGTYATSGQTGCSGASGATTLTEADTSYGSCGCSPLGKLMSQTVPYTYGGNVGATTTYAYDGIGRTLTKAMVGPGSTPDTQGATTYSYAGNSVTVQDPAGNKKVFTMDAFGNLIQVIENPSGLNYTTTYTYDR
jgi:YD repeat-containing protein